MTEEEKKTNPSGDGNLDPEEFDENGNPVNKDTDNPKNGNPNQSNNPNETKSEEELEKERRSKYAAERREREARERAEKERLAREEQLKKEAATKAELDLVKTNPYTEKPITDEYDLEVYKLQKKLEAEGKDPIKDLPEALALRDRELAQARAKELKDKEVVDKQLKEEIAELRKKYPKVNTKELGDDPLFLEISEEKEGRWTVTEIYEEYLKRKGTSTTTTTTTTTTEEEANKGAKKVTKQPSSNPGGKPLKDNYMEMTDEEYLKLQAENRGDFF